MTDKDRQSLLIDQTKMSDHPGDYIPIESVDRSLYDIVHPENALTRLNMTARTAYRKMDSGDLTYTIEQGSKRVVVRKSQTKDRNNDSQMSESVSQSSDVASSFERLLDKMPDLQSLLSDRDAELKLLRESLQRTQENHRNELDSLRRSHESVVQSLRESLEAERIKNAHAEAKLSSVSTMEALVDTQKETISSQKTTIDSLNNERFVINNQLQKYREAPSVPSDSDRQAVSQKSFFEKLFGR